MREELNSRISRFIDDELDKHDALELLRSVQSNAELDKKMRRYEEVSHAIKAEMYLPIAPNFVSRVSKELELEPVYLIPPRNSIKQRYMKITAIAASIALAAVVVEQVNQQPSSNFQSQFMLADNKLDEKMTPVDEVEPQLNSIKSNENPSIVVATDHQQPRNGKTEKVEQMSVDQKFDHYLQAHSGNLYASGSNYQAYAQVASYGQE